MRGGLLALGTVGALALGAVASRRGSRGVGVDPAQTPAFRRWFEDSKVIDADGKPLVVYHATTYGDFDTFDKAEQRKGMAGYGFYFSDREGANLYADHGLAFRSDRSWNGKEKRVSVMPVYLKMANPLVAENIADVKVRYGNRDPGGFGVGRTHAGMAVDALTAVQRDGYDGVIAHEYIKRLRGGAYAVVEPGTRGAVQHPVYVVFESAQVKSTSGNSGAFDPADPRISANRTRVKASGGSRNTESPAFDAWFQNSVVRNPDGTPRIVVHQTTEDAADRIVAQGFRLDLPGARKSDEQMPNGIFLKTHANPIGIRGPFSAARVRQISLHARLLHPFYVQDRYALERWLRQDSAWVRIKDQIDRVDREGHAEADACFKARAALGRPDGTSHLDRAITSRDHAIDAAQKRWRDVLDAWSAAIDHLNAEARARVTERLRSEGYDGLWMANDEGTMGRKTETIVVLDPSQVRFTGPNREFCIGGSANRASAKRPKRGKDDPVPTQILPAGTLLYHGTAHPRRFEEFGTSVFTSPFWVSRDPRVARMIALDDADEDDRPPRIFHLRTTRDIGPLAVLKTDQDIADLVADVRDEPRERVQPGSLGSYQLARVLARESHPGWIAPGNYGSSRSIFSYGETPVCRPSKPTCDDICLCLSEDVASLDLFRVEAVSAAEVQARRGRVS